MYSNCCGNVLAAIVATIIAKSSLNAAENSWECTVLPSKVFLINHPLEENDSLLSPRTMLNFEDKTLVRTNRTPVLSE